MASISIQNEKLALQLKYMLSLTDLAAEDQTLKIVNRLHPFNQSPLSKLPPLELIEYQPYYVITDNLRELLQSYALIVVLGNVRAQKGIYYVDEQRIVDDSIRDKLVYNFDEGETELTTLACKVTVLKVHKIWVRIAQQERRKKEMDYVRLKLSKIPFFQKLTFQEFDKVLNLATLYTIGPGQTLIAQCAIPYHMYIVTEGQFILQKRVSFAEQGGAWNQLQAGLQKRDNFSEQMFEYLVRDPSEKSNKFQIVFEIGKLGQGSMVCGMQTLNQLPLGYSIRSSLKTRYLALKYPDLYVLEQSRLSQIRNWPTQQIDKKQLRRQYYYERNWQIYKYYLTQQQKLSELQAQKFQDFLRKQVNMAMKKYSYASGKVGEGYIVDSPAGKMNRIREMTFFKG